jgi:alanine dehydrogenase
LSFEAIHRISRLLFEDDLDHDGCGARVLVGSATFDDGRVAANDAIVFKKVKATEARGGREPDAGGELRIGDATVLLKKTDDAAVGGVERAHATLLEWMIENANNMPENGMHAQRRRGNCGYVTHILQSPMEHRRQKKEPHTMRVGVPKEIKDHEYRVGLMPSGVRELTALGHEAIVETRAGAGIGYNDDAYIAAGAKIAASAEEVFAKGDTIVKVKEPQPVECRRLREGQVLFTYLHLAPDPEQAKALKASGCTAIAYETVVDRAGRLPLLAPMSEIAGRMAIQVGAVALQKRDGGSGVLLGGVPGVLPAKVVVLGGGVVGTNSARMAMGLGADVTVLDRSLARLAELDGQYGPLLKTCFATSESVERLVVDADLVVGAVLVAGANAPRLVTRAQIARMRPGSVLVDVSIDQGGCFETSRATTHSDPTYIVDGVVHYCVANMPGGVARTSTQALTNATLPYVIALATKGWQKAVAEDAGLLAGLNIHSGKVVHAVLAEALGEQFVAPFAVTQVKN